MPLEAWLLSFGSAWLFAQGYVLTQIGFRHVTPALGASLSMPTAMIVFWASAPFFASLDGWNDDAVLVFAAVGLFYPAAITLLTFEANRLMGPYVSGALGNLAPLLAVVAGVAVLGETLEWGQGAAILAIVLGVTGLSMKRTWENREWRRWALLLPFGAALFRGLGAPALKLGLEIWPNPFVATLICYAVSATVAVTVGLIRTRNVERRVTPRGIMVFAVVGLSNGFAVLCWISALALGPVSIVTPIVSCYPVFTLLIGSVLLRGAKIGVQHVTSVVLTVIGVALLITL